MSTDNWQIIHDNLSMNNRDELRKAFSERLNTALVNVGKDARGKGVYLQKELKNKNINVSAESIRKWLSGLAIPAIDNLTALAEITKVSPAWLQYGMEEKNNTSSIVDAKLLGVIDCTDKEEILIPFIKEVIANNNKTIKESITQKYRFSKQLVENLIINPAHVKCLKVKGNNMERLIINESLVAIDTSDKEVIDSEIYAIDHNGILRVCYLYRHPITGGIRIRHENTQEYPDELISLEERSTIRILGRVFWWATIRYKKS